MRHVESNIQIAAVRWFRYQYRDLSPLLFSVPNGGARNAVTASIMKAEGVVPGVADLLLLVPRHGFHGLAIEMKTAKGRQSDNQKAWEQAVSEQGYKYVVIRSLEEFIGTVTRYLTSDKPGKNISQKDDQV